MKSDIHPKYQDVTVTCGCGESFTTRSTSEKLVVEICSKCHPFYTGNQRIVDTAGRVEKFQRRYGWSGDKAAVAAGSAAQGTAADEGDEKAAVAAASPAQDTAADEGGEKAAVAAAPPEQATPADEGGEKAAVAAAPPEQATATEEGGEKETEA